MAATKKKRPAKKAAPTKKAQATAQPKSAAKRKAATKKAATKKHPAAKKPAAAKSKKPSAAKPKKPAAPKKSVAAKKLVAAKKTAATAAKKRPVGGKSGTAAAKGAAKKTARPDVLDLGAFPPGTFTRRASLLCLACVFELFTKQFGLAPRTASAEIKRYAPSVEELTARQPQRPFFKDSGEKNPRCPYCEAAKRWHARVEVVRVEGVKATDAARRALFKRLPAREGQFQIQEARSNARAVFFEWLEALGQELDFEDDRAWMLAAARAYLERRDPKTDWAEVFGGVRQVRRSHRLEEGFGRDGSRLFVAPAVYNDVLLVQYLVSRSHRHGGRTFEGRLTLPELVRRMRHAGHLHARGIDDRDQFDVLERLVEGLSGGDAPVKLHYVVDRRDLLEKVRTVYESYAT
jgi:hypothetical protein